MCEDCGFKHASFGDKIDRKVRWCGTCVKANNHQNTMYLMASGRWCEDCSHTVSAWGIQVPTQRRSWAGCVKNNGPKDAVLLGAQMCEAVIRGA